MELEHRLAQCEVQRDKLREELQAIKQLTTRYADEIVSLREALAVAKEALMSFSNDVFWEQSKVTPWEYCEQAVARIEEIISK